MKLVAKFLKNADAAVAVEYAILLAISGAILTYFTAASGIPQLVAGKFQTVQNALTP